MIKEAYLINILKEKAKAYDGALERMKSWAKGEHPECFTEAQKAAEFIFPELKESEDEKIRKELISFLQSYDTLLTQKFIAWLEKQVNPYSGTSFKYNDHTWWGMKPQGKTALEATKEEKVDNQNCVKPTDKPELKFKVGDWISGDYTNYKVTAINSKGYVVEDTDGNKINILFENEKFHHLFTIADAKDGDVLVDVYGNICIFEKHDDFDWTSYFSLECDGCFRFFRVEHENEKTYPATKEQRDLLFKKIKDEGLQWDADKKELRKIDNRFDYEHANIKQKDFAPKSTTANRQLYNRAILKLLSYYVEKYPDIRFGQMLCNLGVNPHFDQESRETYWNLSKTINKQNHE